MYCTAGMKNSERASEFTEDIKGAIDIQWGTSRAGLLKHPLQGLPVIERHHEGRRPSVITHDSQSRQEVRMRNPAPDLQLSYNPFVLTRLVEHPALIALYGHEGASAEACPR